MRGYAAIDATVAGVTYRVVNTHLEATLEALPGTLQATQAIRVAQARELAANLNAETLPVILLGDFNTPAPDGPAYQLLLREGYADVWQADSEGSGNTCCQDADLRNVESDLGKRIDQIFIKGVSLREGATIRTATVGDAAEDKTPGGLWPSDHAGVVAHLPVGVAYGRSDRRTSRHTRPQPAFSVRRAADQRPRQTGGRFSMNACMPSRASSLASIAS